ncbi:DUF1549 domain-containing protein [Pirellula sp. SH-Sr6A]|uniref:DUF1549 domain-containing protein n=1 Tax=Pirellula sp. SH-Sr6A TaxID=1632865 RepID=UPI00143BB5BB|nr:DUF1549 domain-containing protein [Pirellula sp. SH-Sr6A]
MTIPLACLNDPPPLPSFPPLRRMDYLMSALHRFAFGLAILLGCFHFPGGSCTDLCVHAEETEAAPAAGTVQVGERVEFAEEVSAILTRAGCNSGTCHGSLFGKGGFRLSLKGQDPDLDYRSIVEDLSGRRIDLSDPSASLLLAKPAGSVAHQGGMRIRPDSIEWENLHRWIAEGAAREDVSRKDTAPKNHRLVRIDLDVKNSDETVASDDPLVSASSAVHERWIPNPDAIVSIRCLAHWEDGSTSDVTNWTKLEVTSLSGAHLSDEATVRVDHPMDTTITAFFLGKHAALRLNFVDPRQSKVASESSSDPAPSLHWVDQAIERRVAKLGLRLEPEAASELWVRRLYLTVLGRLPTLSEQSGYLDDNSDDRDIRAIDRVLADPQYASLLALKWSDVLRNEPKAMSEKGVALWFDWLRTHFQEDTPLPEMMKQMLTGMGSTFESPAASFHRTHRDPNASAEAVGQVFLGIRMQCAKCHNHPFDVWTQDDYYGLSAYFVPIDRKQIDNNPRDALDTHVITGDEVISWSDKKPEIYHPGLARMVSARPLTSSSDDASSTSADAAPDRHPLESLAESLVRENEQFERNMVNRLWAHVFGRGIVDPIDDFRSTNPASNPELLEALRQRYRENGYSTRWLMREMLSSQAFRRGPLALDGSMVEEARAAQFAGFAPRRLMAEVLQDALADATLTINRFDNQTEAKGAKAEGQFVARAVSYPSVPKKHDILRAFGKPERLTDCDCERSTDSSLRQSLLLLNDAQIRNRLLDSQGLVQRIASDVSNPAALENAVTTLYRSVLCRLPSREETEFFVGVYARQSDAKLLLEDLAWALINSKEFLFLR